MSKSLIPNALKFDVVPGSGVAFAPVKMLNGFGMALRKLRQERELSQGELGERSGVGTSLISKYEREEVIPGVDQFDVLLTGLGADLRQFADALDIVNGRKTPGESRDAALVRGFERVFNEMFELRKAMADAKQAGDVT